jgi:predicted secreted protein
MIFAETGGGMGRWEAALRGVAVTAIFVAAHGVAAGQAAERFSGMMPCADCSGIRTTLTLDRDTQDAPTTYTMSEIYVGRPAAKNPETSGTWTIVRGDASDKSATVYQLHPTESTVVSSFVKVSDTELRLLDGSLGEIPASVPHTLKRVPAMGGASVITEQTKGEVSLKMGSMLEVRLEANHTTGYSWVARPVATPVLVMLGTATYQENAAEGKMGAGGGEIWQFKAQKTGKETLQFEYRRPWEKNVPAAKTVTFQIAVQ